MISLQLSHDLHSVQLTNLGSPEHISQNLHGSLVAFGSKQSMQPIQSFFVVRRSLQTSQVSQLVQFCMLYFGSGRRLTGKRTSSHILDSRLYCHRSSNIVYPLRPPNISSSRSVLIVTRVAYSRASGVIGELTNCCCHKREPV